MYILFFRQPIYQLQNESMNSRSKVPLVIFDKKFSLFVFAHFGCPSFFLFAVRFINESTKCMLTTPKCRYMIHNLYFVRFFSFLLLLLLILCIQIPRLNDSRTSFLSLLTCVMLLFRVGNRFASSSTFIIVNLAAASRLLLFHFTEYGKLFFFVSGLFVVFHIFLLILLVFFLLAMKAQQIEEKKIYMENSRPWFVFILWWRR